MKNAILLTMWAVALLVAVPKSSIAQYLFADTNGDGVLTTADHLNSAGQSTIAIWLQTDRNKDGSPARNSVDPSRPLTLFSYEFILRATGGTMKWGAYTNLMPNMPVTFGPFQNSTDYYNGFGGTTMLPPGKYKLGTLVATVASGTPRLSFVSTTPIWAPLHTSFGSQCAGKDGDYTLKFTEDPSMVGRAAQDVAGDWTGSDGVAGPVGAALTSSAPSDAQSSRAHPDGVSPNPLNPQGWITFSMKVAGSARVTLYDTQGRLVRTLLPKQALPAGSRSVRIDGLDDRGKKLGSGVYFYTIETPDGQSRGRFVVMK